VELCEQQRLPLVVRQARDVAEQLAQVSSPGDLVGEAERGRLLVGELRLRAASAQHADALVARDPVEPWAHAQVPLGADDPAIGVDEGLLDGVLRLVPGAEHVAAEREQVAVVTLVEGLEGRVTAGADPLDEPLVGREPEQPRRAFSRRARSRGSASDPSSRLHAFIIGRASLR
jgi:hypothetical protein